MRKELTGKGGSDGVGVGRIWTPVPKIEKIIRKYLAEDSSKECEKLAKAMATVAERFNEMADAARKRGEAAQADVLEAHALIADDPMVREQAEERIKKGMDAVHALSTEAEEQAAGLAILEDEYLKARAEDVRQAARAVVAELCGVSDEPAPEGKIVLAGEDIEPAHVASVPKERLAGIILCGGTPLGHIFILARERAIPAVSLSKKNFSELASSMEVMVDGSRGIVVCEPDEKEKKMAEKATEDKEVVFGPAVTADGVEVNLRANVANPEAAELSQKKGAAGIGLFRSEFLFAGKSGLPTEDEQYEAYRGAVIACGKAPCIIRMLDAGGDKPIEGVELPKEMNPFLGVRGIRAELQNEDVLRTQLRALLRAAACGHCAVMIPMVTNPSEIDRVKKIAEEEYELLKKKGTEAALPNFGAMVETPAAAVCAKTLAKHAGFFSIGTNDLTQYTLAADRTNEAVADIGDALHPAVLKLIQRTIEAANRAGIPVTICGEIASDPLAAPILAAMGRTALSMSVGAIPAVRKALGGVSIKEAKEKLETALTLDDAKAVREFLK